MKSNGFIRALFLFLRENLPAVFLFTAVASILFAGLNNAARGSAAEEKRLAEESIRRAVISCYAIEGRYPENYGYIREHYDVRIDEEKYYVVYDVFASNIMPDITVLEVGG